MSGFINPYRPGAGHMPPYLAGRIEEKREFERILEQETVLENMILTGLRGVGKTVFLETLKPLAISSGWRWVGTDLSESASLTEEHIAVRLLADLSTLTSSVVVSKETNHNLGFSGSETERNVTMDYDYLTGVFAKTPGLVSDKLKAVLEHVWSFLKNEGQSKGVIFTYDEAQNLADHADKDQYPLSVLLDVFQSIQKKNIPFMLLLTGLPTLFPKLVDARTFAERMFHVVTLGRLTDAESEKAIRKPVKNAPISFTEDSVSLIIKTAKGYPYFIQFICRETYDVFIQQHSEIGSSSSVPMPSILAKLDADFFDGRWSRATDRQRELLRVVSTLENCNEEFSVQEISEKSKEVIEKPFSSSHVNQMLASLIKVGLIYKNRFGRYSFAVPLMGEFIRRQYTTEPNV